MFPFTIPQSPKPLPNCQGFTWEFSSTRWGPQKGDPSAALVEEIGFVRCWLRIDQVLFSQCQCWTTPNPQQPLPIVLKPSQLEVPKKSNNSSGWLAAQPVKLDNDKGKRHLLIMLKLLDFTYTGWIMVTSLWPPCDLTGRMVSRILPIWPFLLPYYIVNQWLITQMDINSHPFRSDARQVVRHVVEAEMGSHYIVSPPFDLVGCFKDDLWLGLEDGQWPELRRNIKVLQVVKIGFQDVWDKPILIAVEYIYIYI